MTSDATKGQIISKLGDLSYIEWDQITGVGGPGTAMEFLCQGGYGVIYKGRWQVRGQWKPRAPSMSIMLAL